MKHRIAQNTENSTENTEKAAQVTRGDLVLAKVASGELVKRRVWSVGDAVVYLCSERLYKDLLAGSSRLWPIGFPKRDVQIANAATEANR
jgi:hypothetical protein